MNRWWERWQACGGSLLKEMGAVPGTVSQRNESQPPKPRKKWLTQTSEGLWLTPPILMPFLVSITPSLKR